MSRWIALAAMFRNSPIAATSIEMARVVKINPKNEVMTQTIIIFLLLNTFVKKDPIIIPKTPPQ